jgi:hypothetical protein
MMHLLALCSVFNKSVLHSMCVYVINLSHLFSSGVLIYVCK